MAFSPTRFRHRYAWTRVAGAGTIRVRVTRPDGSPVDGASVVLDGTVVGRTSSVGLLVGENMSSGRYDVEGGVSVSSYARLNEGCGGDQNERDNLVTWSLVLPPASGVDRIRSTNRVPAIVA